MPTWPASLPQAPLIGVTASDVDSVLRTSMDSGPPTRRNRFTAHMQALSFPIIFTGTQRAVFDTFYRTTLKQGSLAFDWIDPVDDSVVSVAFTDPPQWTVISDGINPTKRIWQAVLNLEVQP